MSRVLAKSLSPEAFSPYGHVISQGKVQIRGSLYLSKKAPQNTYIFEKHLHSKMVIPMGRTRLEPAYVVVVAPSTPSGGPDVEKAEAFVAKGDQSVTFDVGVWHAQKGIGDTNFAVAVEDDEVDRKEVSIDVQVNPLSKRKPQSQENFEENLQQFQYDQGPLVQEEDYLDRYTGVLERASDFDLKGVKYAAERMYFFGEYQKALDLIDANIGFVKGHKTREFQEIREACREVLGDNRSEL